MWFIQRAHVELVLRSGFPSRNVAFGSWPFPDLSSPDSVAEIPYCDNITIVGRDPARVEQARNQVLSTFEAAGFSMHEISGVDTTAEVLGADLGGDPPVASRYRRKLWLLRQSLAWLASGPVVTGQQIEVIIGHYVAACMYNGAGLAVMRALYSFVADRYLVPTRLWHSCRYEAWIMASVSMLLSSDLCAPWSPRVFATDASSEGFGVCAATVAPELVKEIGAWQEKWRFRRLLPSEWGHRARALGDLDEVTDPRAVDPGAGMELGRWRLREGFPEIPPAILDPSRWKVALAGQFRFDDSISVKEALAAVLAIRLAAKFPEARGKRHLVLVDNFGVVCALARGRAPTFGLSQACRRTSAL